MVHLTLRARQAPAWIALDRELDAWAEAGQSATLWWRDDDAVGPTAELERLLALADGVPLALAVIPAAAQSFPADVTVLQHGWAHEDKAPAGAHKCELAHPSIVEHLLEGRARLARLFGARFLPVMVPPWNRVAPEVAAALPALGYAGMSVLGPRRTPFERNVHVDLMDWTHRGFAGEAEVLEALRRHLSARRRGEVGRDEATGIMTHHLVHGAATERFLARLVEATRTHPAVRWLEPREVFAGP
jgi:hypothetical protein